KTVDAAVNDLLTFPPIPLPPVDPATNMTWVVNGRNGANSPNDELMLVVGSWWLHQNFDATQPISAMQKIFFFLHTSFVTGYQDVEYSENHYYTLRLLLHYVDKSYKELAKKVCLDNGMNDYLDIGESSKGNPNENFVREFFELFTIGKGPTIGPGDYTTFTEDDVRSAARLMTGFRRNDSWADPLLWDVDTGLPRAERDPGNHDETDKAFSAAFQDQIILGRNTDAGMQLEVDEFVDMIFAQQATAKEIVRRLYRFFISYRVTQEIEDDIITPLSLTLIANNYVMVPVISQLLKSQHFYDDDDSDNTDELIGAQIKSPLELQIGMMRFFDLTPPDPLLLPFDAYINFYRWGMQEPLTEACFELFNPPEVAGYQPIYQAPEFNRLWISAKSLPARYALADVHIGTNNMLLNFDLLTWVQQATNITDYAGADPAGTPGPHPGARIGSHLVRELVDYLLPEPIDQARFDYFLIEILLDNLSEMNWMNEWDNYLVSGDETNVRPQIEKLVRALLQSPEYQLG
ncbi:MAG: DUF1800 family protein, partial [Bacteroidota bacterium]